MRGVLALLAAAALPAGCGREAPPPAETPEFRAWKMSHTAMPAAAFAPTLAGEIQVLPAEERSRGPEDFCEIYLNGSRLHRSRMARLPDGTWPECRLNVAFRHGPNRVDVWDSTSNRNHRFTIDTRLGTRVLYSPTAEGYGMEQSRSD